LFIKELEVAMQQGKADIAVHSMKDVPAELPTGFCIAAVLERASSADAFVSASDKTFTQLPHGACIGSSSLRRQAQLKAQRPDLKVQPLRGNVNTRLQKLREGQFDAIILASAGLQRLGLEANITEEFSAEQMLPAAAQGVIGIECLQDRSDLREVLLQLEHAATKLTTEAERAVAATLQANCQSPVASFARIDADILTIEALVASPDGSKVLREQVSGHAEDARTLGNQVAARLLEQGAAALLTEDAE
jgi:hydroxymethylbilane synthase